MTPPPANSLGAVLLIGLLTSSLAAAESSQENAVEAGRTTLDAKSRQQYVAHDEQGRLKGQIPRWTVSPLGVDAKYAICVEGETPWMVNARGRALSVVNLAQSPDDPPLGKCYDATPAARDAIRAAKGDAFLQYEIKRPAGDGPRKPVPSPDGLRDAACKEPAAYTQPQSERRLQDFPQSKDLSDLYAALRRDLEAVMPATPSFLREPLATDSLKVAVEAIAADLKGLAALSSAIEKAEAGAGKLVLPRLLGERLTLETLRNELSACHSVGTIREVAFRGEIPLGGYRKAIALDENGELLGGASTLGLMLKPVDQLIFYVQRSGASRSVFSLAIEDAKSEFKLDTAQAPSAADADWVLERLGEGTSFPGGKNLLLTFSKVDATGVSKEVRKTQLPVLESVRWRVTSGLYYSKFPRRTISASNQMEGGKNVIQEDVRRGTLSPGVFVSFFPWPRTTKPGKPFHGSNLVPGLVIGAQLPNPTKEVMAGVALEPIRGFQVIIGRLWGTQVFAEGQLGDSATSSQVGRPLTLDAPPTVDRFGTQSMFYSVTLDVGVIGSALQKLIDKF